MKFNTARLPCKLWGRHGFLVAEGSRDERMRWSEYKREACLSCPIRERCAQEAADAPYSPVGVWGGLLLPEQASELPAPTPAPSRPRRSVGRPTWWEDSHWSFDPLNVSTGRMTAPLDSGS